MSPKKLLALQLFIAASTLIAAAWLFGEIVEDVVNRDVFLLTIDHRVAEWLHDNATPALTSAMIFISYLGAPVTVICVAVVSALTLFWRRQRYALLVLVLAVPGGLFLNGLMKDAVQRHRPSFTDPLLTLTSYSFPSGHALGSTLLYGVLAAVVVWTANGRHWRVLTIAGAVLLVGLICFSRIYLGVHYLSDVVAGVLAGIVWVMLCLFAVMAFKRGQARRRSRLKERG